MQLYATDGGVKLLKRSNGDLERQYRLNVGKLPVAYRWVPTAGTMSGIPQLLGLTCPRLPDGSGHPVPPSGCLMT